MSDVSMESQKWMQAGLVVCKCCGDSTFDCSETCCRCHMPLWISQRATDQETQIDFIPIVGASGVGKTTYLGMLLELLRQGKYGVTASLENSATIAIQRETLTNLSQRQFPARSSTESDEWSWVHAELDFRGRPRRFSKQQEAVRKKLGLDRNPGIQWVAPDISGVALERELGRPGSYAAIPSSISRSRGVLLLLDALRADKTQLDIEDRVAEKIGQLIHRNTNGQVPVAIAFTKTDACEEAARDPDAFAKKNLPGFYEITKSLFPIHRYFALNVAAGVSLLSGMQGGIYMPMRVQPSGIVEPLAWILTPRG